MGMRKALAGLQIVGLELPPTPEPEPTPADSDPVETPFIFFDEAHRNIVTFASTTAAEDGFAYDDTIRLGTVRTWSVARAT